MVAMVLYDTAFVLLNITYKGLYKIIIIKYYFIADKDDVLRYAERLSMRCLTVDVLVKIQRDQIQEEALHQVHTSYYIFYINLLLFFFLMKSLIIQIGSFR